MSPADCPVPYTLTAKALAALDGASTAPDRPVPFTLTAQAHAALDQDGSR